MVRPKLKVDWKLVDDLLIKGCTGTEIAARLGMHAETLYKRCEKECRVGFSAYSQEKRAIGDALIRATQFDLAVRERDRGMLIWLGKNRLKQTEKETIEHIGEVPLNIVSYNGKELKPWKDGN